MHIALGNKLMGNFSRYSAFCQATSLQTQVHSWVNQRAGTSLSSSFLLPSSHKGYISQTNLITNYYTCCSQAAPGITSQANVYYWALLCGVGTQDSVVLQCSTVHFVSCSLFCCKAANQKLIKLQQKQNRHVRSDIISKGTYRDT